MVSISFNPPGWYNETSPSPLRVLLSLQFTCSFHRQMEQITQIHGQNGVSQQPPATRRQGQVNWDNEIMSPTRGQQLFPKSSMVNLFPLKSGYDQSLDVSYYKLKFLLPCSRPKFSPPSQDAGIKQPKARLEAKSWLMMMRNQRN